MNDKSDFTLLGTFSLYKLKVFVKGLGHFGDVASATDRFGDGSCKCFIRKKCVFEIQ